METIIKINYDGKIQFRKFYEQLSATVSNVAIKFSEDDKLLLSVGEELHIQVHRISNAIYVQLFSIEEVLYAFDADWFCNYMRSRALLDQVEPISNAIHKFYLERETSCKSIH